MLNFNIILSAPSPYVASEHYILPSILRTRSKLHLETQAIKNLSHHSLNIAPFQMSKRLRRSSNFASKYAAHFAQHLTNFCLNVHLRHTQPADPVLQAVKIQQLHLQRQCARNSINNAALKSTIAHKNCTPKAVHQCRTNQLLHTRQRDFLAFTIELRLNPNNPSKFGRPINACSTSPEVDSLTPTRIRRFEDIALL